MTARPPHVGVVGSANVDLTVRTPRLPRPGETLTGHAFHAGCGGKGANQAVAAARLGARVTFLARIGRDLFGEQTLRNLRDQGIDPAHVLLDLERPTGVAAIAVDDAAQNTIVVVPGANGGLTPDDVRGASAALAACNVLLCQLEVPLETTAEALRVARAAGVRTILNPAPAVPLSDELLSLADLCVPNETEAELLAGFAVRTPADAQAAAEALRRRGVTVVLVTLGAGGVLVADARGFEHVPAAAALAVTRPGAQAALPTRAELEAFLGRL